MPNDRAKTRSSADQQTGSQCQHARLLEAVYDAHDNLTDRMKCCECGAIVSRPSHRMVNTCIK